MAENWRRREPRGRDQRERWWPNRRTSGGYGRPPLSPGHHPLSNWEKRFCTYVCSISWKQLCETKELMYLYPKIVEWNDSEGEAAFNNAKARYWAEVNHLSCPIPLPDPNMYIDVVDYDTIVDPKLLEDLYELPPPFDYEKENNNPIELHQIQPTGWGDDEDQLPSIYTSGHYGQIQPTGWGDEDDQLPTTIYPSNEPSQIQPTEWGDENDQLPIMCTADQCTADHVSNIQSTGWGEAEYQTSGTSDKRKTHSRSRSGLNYTDGGHRTRKKDGYSGQGKLQWKPKNSRGPAKPGGGEFQ